MPVHPSGFSARGSAPPQTRTGSVERTRASDTTFNVRGNVCGERNCTRVVHQASLRVLTVPGIETVSLPGSCGPRWGAADLSTLWSPCLEISEICNLTPRFAVTLFSVDAAGSTLVGGVQLDTGDCTTAFAGPFTETQRTAA